MKLRGQPLMVGHVNGRPYEVVMDLGRWFLGTVKGYRNDSPDIWTEFDDAPQIELEIEFRPWFWLKTKLGWV